MDDESDSLSELLGKKDDRHDPFLDEVSQMLGAVSQDFFDAPLEDAYDLKFIPEPIVEERMLSAENPEQKTDVMVNEIQAEKTHEVKYQKKEMRQCDDQNQEAVDSIYWNHNNRKQATSFEDMIRRNSGLSQPIVFDEKELALSTKSHCMFDMLQEIESKFGNVLNLKELQSEVEKIVRGSDKRMAVEPAKCKKKRLSLEASEPHGYIRFHLPIKDLKNRLSRSASHVGRLSQKKGAALFIEAFKNIGEKAAIEETEIELKAPGWKEDREGKLIQVFDCKVENKKILIIEALYAKGSVLDMIVFNSMIKTLSEKLYSAIKSEIAVKQLNQTENFLEKVKIYIPEEVRKPAETKEENQNDSSFDSKMNLDDVFEKKEEQLMLNFPELWKIDLSNLHEMVERLFLKYPKINSLRLEELLRRTDFYYFEEGTRQLVNAAYRLMQGYLQRAKCADLWVLRTKAADEAFESQLLLEHKHTGQASPVKKLVYHDLNMLIFAEAVTAMSLVFENLLEKVSMKNLVRMIRNSGNQPLVEYKPANKKNPKPVVKKLYNEMVPSNLHQDGPKVDPPKQIIPKSDSNQKPVLSPASGPPPTDLRATHPHPPPPPAAATPAPVAPRPASTSQAAEPRRPVHWTDRRLVEPRPYAGQQASCRSRNDGEQRSGETSRNATWRERNERNDQRWQNDRPKAGDQERWRSNEKNQREIGVLGKRKPMEFEEDKRKQELDYSVIEIESTRKKGPPENESPIKNKAEKLLQRNSANYKETVYEQNPKLSGNDSTTIVTTMNKSSKKPSEQKQDREETLVDMTMVSSQHDDFPYESDSQPSPPRLQHRNHPASGAGNHDNHESESRASRQSLTTPADRHVHVQQHVKVDLQRGFVASNTAFRIELPDCDLWAEYQEHLAAQRAEHEIGEAATMTEVSETSVDGWLEEGPGAEERESGESRDGEEEVDIDEISVAEVAVRGKTRDKEQSEKGRMQELRVVEEEDAAEESWEGNEEESEGEDDEADEEGDDEETESETSVLTISQGELSEIVNELEPTQTTSSVSNQVIIQKKNQESLNENSHLNKVKSAYTTIIPEDFKNNFNKNREEGKKSEYSKGTPIKEHPLFSKVSPQSKDTLLVKPSSIMASMKSKIDDLQEESKF